MDVSYCPNITEKSWLNIGWYRKNIVNINLQGNKKLKKLGKNTFSLNNFKQLKKLNIFRCELEQKIILIRLENIKLITCLNNQIQQDLNNANVAIDIVLMDDTASGKSGCIDRFINGTFKFNSYNTVDVKYNVKRLQITEQTVDLKIWDTQYQERAKDLYLSYYRKAKTIILFMEITSKFSFNTFTQCATYLQKKFYNELPTLLVANKCDLKDQQEFSYEEGVQLAYKIGALTYVECSAKENINIDEVFTLAIKGAMDKDIKTIDINNMNLAVPLKNAFSEKPYDYDIKIVLAGGFFGVGKSKVM